VFQKFLAAKGEERKEKAKKVKFAMSEVADGLDEIRLTNPELADKYHKAIEGVFRYMPLKAIHQVVRNCRGWNFYAESDELQEDYYERSWPAIREKFAGKGVEAMTAAAAKHKELSTRVGGVWSWDRSASGGAGAGEIHLNGGERSPSDMVGIMAHELTHAIEGDFKHSHSEEWKEIWKEEIYDGLHHVSNYATESSHEGWAEFGRLLYTGSGSDDVRNYFPQAYAYFKKHGFAS